MKGRKITGMIAPDAEPAILAKYTKPVFSGIKA